MSEMDDRSRLRALHRAPESQVLAALLVAATLPPFLTTRVGERARNLVSAARAAHRPGTNVSDFLLEYRLDTREGVALLCLAEALLRIPDAATADALDAKMTTTLLDRLTDHYTSCEPETTLSFKDSKAATKREKAQP